MQTATRTTKYSKAVIAFLDKNGHATNREILNGLRLNYPELSATTIHRLTARLAERGLIGLAPSDAAGCQRYDFDPKPHHHFACSCCGGLRDVKLENDFLHQLSSQLEGCVINGQLVINGACSKCYLNTGAVK